MVKANPSVYQKYVISDKKCKKILHKDLQKAIYRTLKISLLFYQKLVKQLMRAGFKLNAYNPCVVNIMIE